MTSKTWLPSARDGLFRAIVLGTLINAALIVGARPEQELGGDSSRLNLERQAEKSFWQQAREPVSLLTLGILVFNGLLVYVTCRLVNSTNRLWKAGERQLLHLQQTSERQLRAYLCIKEIKNGEVTSRATGTITAYWFACEWHNAGQTPATSVRNEILRCSEAPGVPVVFKREAKTTDPTLTISANQAAGTNIVEFALGEIQDAFEKTKKIYLFSEVTYNHVFSPKPNREIECVEIVVIGFDGTTGKAKLVFDVITDFSVGDRDAPEVGAPS